MGITTSMLPELVAVALRATGPALSTAAFLRGRYAYAMFLWLLIHFVILMSLDVPLLEDTEATFAYSVTYPLIALGFSILSLFNFYLLKLGELLPLNRYLASCCGQNLGPKPSGAFILVNLIGWLVVSVVSEILFEYFVNSDVILAVCLLMGVIIVGYAALTLIHLFWLADDAAGWGDGSSILRTFLVTGVYHLVSALVLGMIVIFRPDHNWAWIAALVVLVVEFIVTIIIYFTLARCFTLPPRTGQCDSFKKIGVIRDTKVYTGDDDAVEVTADTDDMSARYGARGGVFGRRTDATAPLFATKND
jgi:hypothetical protein